MMDIEDVDAIVKERRLAVRQHNGWQFLPNERAVTLSEPNHYNVMTADTYLSIKDCYLNPYSAFVFHLEYIVEVQGNRQTVIVAKYDFVPVINSIMKVDGEDIDAKMGVGPDITVGNQLVLAEQNEDGEAAGFSEFNLRVFLSMSPTPPEQFSLSRSEFSIPDALKNPLNDGSMLQMPDQKKAGSFISPRDLMDPTIRP